MRYLGSKTLLVSQIERLIYECCTEGILLDPFGGIGTIGAHMKKRGFQVYSGDLLYFANCFQKTLIEFNHLPSFSKIMDNQKYFEDLEKFINNLEVKDGWFVDEYAIKRKYFTIENAYHIQGCINWIWQCNQNKLIDESEYAVLIASLIQSMDYVANTAGTYYAYLKQFYRKAKRKFIFKFMEPVEGNEHCICELCDANELIRKYSCDILYLDPPYNERDYAGYYHLPETIANGIIPIPKGKSGVYTGNSVRSQYTQKSTVNQAFEDLVKNSKSKYILFHYTDNGLINTEYIREVLNSVGLVTDLYFDCKGYNTTKEIRKNQHHIFKVVRK